MKHIFTVEIETDDNIIGTKEVIAAVLENFGKVTFPMIAKGVDDNAAET